MSSTAKNKAIRRNLLAKKKAKLRHIVKNIWKEGKLASDPKFIGRMARTPHSCSGFCCGNPRRKAKGKEALTLQERKARDNAA